MSPDASPPSGELLPFIALTGTPGTGKSTVRHLLPVACTPTEVADLAIRIGSGRRTKGDRVVVDLRKTRRWVRRHSDSRSCLLVGHLAHLLVVRDVIVLRCHPATLEQRLVRARKGDRGARHENMLAEALGVVSAEAIARKQNVFEIDTTRKSPSRVAREVSAWVDGPRRARFGQVDWLRDANVTKHLLEWTR